jgi:hypothetical protein
VDTIDYGALLQKYPWIAQRDQNCILSPDSDGLLCGLLMSFYLGWKVRGYYDGKILIIEDGFHASDCVFLDMEIFRPNIRSVGQHMVMYDKARLPPNWHHLDNCISANNLRNYDYKNDFKVKYPFGTIHLLLGVLGQGNNIPISKNAIGPLLYTDGTFKNQFNYPENCISWLNFLGASTENNPLQKVFQDPHYSIYELMLELKDFFSKISIIGGGKRGGDKIKISDSKGNSINLDPASRRLLPETQAQAENFIRMLAERTGWNFNPGHWSQGPYTVYKFKKGSIKPGKATYNDLLAQDPVSLAIISGLSIEYTTDESGHL